MELINNFYIKSIKEYHLDNNKRKELFDAAQVLNLISLKKGLIESYLWTVYKFSWAIFKRTGRRNFWDITQQANLGLVIAVNKFQGVYEDFKPYVYRVMRNIVFSYLQKRPLVPIYSTTFNRLKEFLGTDKIPDDRNLRLFLNLTKSVLSLDAPIINEEGEDATWAEILENKRAIPPSTQLIRKAVREWVNDSINSLPGAEAVVLEYYFGLKEDRKTFKGISKELNIPEKEVKSRLTNAMIKLRHPSRCGKLRKRLRQIKEIEKMMEI